MSKGILFEQDPVETLRPAGRIPLSREASNAYSHATLQAAEARKGALLVEEAVSIIRRILGP